MAKSVVTNLVKTLERAANLITPNFDNGDEAGQTPLQDGVASYAELGYRIGRALSLARRLKRGE